MLYLTEDQARQWDVFKNRIPLNTFKFLKSQLEEQYKEVLQLEKFIRKNPEDSQSLTRFNYLQERLLKNNKILSTHHTIVIPPDQSQFCSMGTAVLVDIQGEKREKKWVIPDVCTTSPETVSFTNPLCQAILGKERFEEGFYENINTGKKIRFQILDILSYSQTKRRFFSKKPEKEVAVA